MAARRRTIGPELVERGPPRAREGVRGFVAQHERLARGQEELDRMLLSLQQPTPRWFV